MNKFSVVLLITLLSSMVVDAQAQLPSIEEKTEQMESFSGFIPFYWDASTGKIWLEIQGLGEEILYLNATSGGLGSNGFDRNSLGQSKLVKFERVGPKLLMIEPNYAFRYSKEDADRQEAVQNAFGQSAIWGFKIEAESDGKVLIDATNFLLRDALGWAGRLGGSRGGSYRFDDSKSAVNLDLTLNFPENTEFDVLLTFTGTGFRGKEAPSGEAISLKLHHSFVQLPDDQFTPRKYDPRSSFMSFSYLDFASPFYENLEHSFVVKHRLEKKNPQAKRGEPIEPIVYYVDRGVPPDILDAVIEGASWWNNAFEAAGYTNAFLVKLLPDGAHALDIRYNMINWTNRSSRGWSYGSTITDPRTGEIIKGNVNMGALRIRQDYLILTGIAGEYDKKKHMKPAVKEAALLRIKQLSAHEVGHTLGLVHNYISNVNNRSSVMDYPHPLIKITKNGTIDLSDAYTQDIGAWDQVSITYGYQDYPDNQDADLKASQQLDKAFEKGILYMTDKDASINIHPLVSQWDNGTHPTAELKRVMALRQLALDRFSEKKIRSGESLSWLEMVLVPVYFFHRYQITASAGVIGGLYYNHTLNGGKQEIMRAVPSEEQFEALEAILEAIAPGNLSIPDHILKLLPPRAPNHSQSVELFSGYTGGSFDPLAAAENIADLCMGLLLDPARTARLVNHHALDVSQPGLDKVLERIFDSSFKAQVVGSYHLEIQRTVNLVVLKRLFALIASEKSAPQAKALAYHELIKLQQWLSQQNSSDPNQQAHHQYCLKLIQQFEKNPDQFILKSVVDIPNGAPIGGW